MSRPITEAFPCPQCQKQHKFTIWSSLNVTLDPALKSRLLSGDLTRFTCDACSYSAQIVHSMLYHDMQSGIMVWLIPPKSDGAPGDIPDDLPPSVLDKFGKNYRFRQVDVQNQLIEKILLFDAGLDDRLIELAKLMIHANVPPEHRTEAMEIYFSGIAKEGETEMMNFTVLRAGRQSGSSVARDAVCTFLLEKFQSALNQPPPGRWPRIDRNYALQIMMNDQGTSSDAPEPPPSQANRTPPPSKKRWWRFGK